MNSDWEQEVVGTHRHLVASQQPPNLVVSGKQSPRFSAYYSAEGSVEESEPASPTAGPPANFDEVVPGIYRSSFPKMGNFEFLGTLGLRTILTLVDEQYPAENKEFIIENGIKHVQIPIPANKNPSDVIPPKSMARALELLFNKKYHPILVHCNKGKASIPSRIHQTPAILTHKQHRTGCVIGCWRKMNDMPMGAIIQEYRQYAGIKARALDEKFIETFDENSMYNILDDIVLTRAAERRPLMTPPNSVKDDLKEDGQTSSRENSKASEKSLQ